MSLYVSAVSSQVLSAPGDGGRLIATVTTPANTTQINASSTNTSPTNTTQANTTRANTTPTNISLTVDYGVRVAAILRTSSGECSPWSGVPGIRYFPLSRAPTSTGS